MTCLFCKEEGVHAKKVPNRNVMVDLCDEHYISKSSGEILEFYRDNIENEPKEKIVVEGYCMHCKAHREMLGVEDVLITGKKGDRKSKTGFCAKCNTKIVKIVKST